MRYLDGAINSIFWNSKHSYPTYLGGKSIYQVTMKWHWSNIAHFRIHRKRCFLHGAILRGVKTSKTQFPIPNSTLRYLSRQLDVVDVIDGGRTSNFEMLSLIFKSSKCNGFPRFNPKNKKGFFMFRYPKVRQKDQLWAAVLRRGGHGPGSPTSN